jgi:hypothetical protein
MTPPSSLRARIDHHARRPPLGLCPPRRTSRGSAPLRQGGQVSPAGAVIVLIVAGIRGAWRTLAKVDK